MTYLVKFGDGWECYVGAENRGDARALAGEFAQLRSPHANHSDSCFRKYGDKHPLRIVSVESVKEEAAVA